MFRTDFRGWARGSRSRTHAPLLPGARGGSMISALCDLPVAITRTPHPPNLERIPPR